MWDREQAVGVLISDDLNTLYECSDSSVRSVLEWGFKGYFNMTDEELMNELMERDISILFGETE
jgi:hypothetical protein